MSTLKTNTLSNAAGSKSVPVDTVVDGSAKAWVNFNGTGTVAIRAAFNVSSITDLGVGTYRVNLTTAMPDVNYAVTCSCQILSVTGGYVITPTGAYLAGSVEVYAYSAPSTGSGDPSFYSVAIFR
jgi:hypothetical protein